MNPRKITYFTAFFVLVFLTISIANVYYTDVTAGNDVNPGTETLPWKTIQKAANTLIAGDTVYIKAGTYTPSQKIDLINSGTAENFISFMAYPGDEHLVIIDGSNIPLTGWYGVFTVSSKEYIRVSGIKIINSSYAGIFVENSSGIMIDNNYTDKTHSSGISVWDSRNITVNNNIVRRACWPSDGIQECISIANTDSVLVSNNIVYDGGSIGFGGGGEGIDLKDGCQNGIVYNNTVHDVASVGIYIDAYETGQSNIQVLKNTVYNISGVGVAVASEEGGALQDVIVSKNTVYNCDDRALVIHWTNKPDYVIKNIYVHHNTFYDNGEGLDIGAHSQSGNINIYNNIFSRNSIYQMQNSSTDLNPSEIHLKNNLFDGENPDWALRGDDYISAEPGFVDVQSGDFRLNDASPAIDQGTFLTKTIGSGMGSTVEVENAGFFTNGYGLKEGDSIRFEGQTQQFEIIAVDFTLNTITLNDETSWDNGNGVSLSYNGNYPDIGAYEYDSPSGIHTTENESPVIYPNPTNGVLFLSDKYAGGTYQIFSILGSVVGKGKINSNKINISDICSGVYILKIINRQSNDILIKKFIKK